MTRVAAALLLLANASCGGASPPPTPATDDDPDALTEAAAEAWAELDPEQAAALADRAVAAGGATVAMEIAARAHLALGQPAEAEAALERASSAHLRRLRARAQIATGDHGAAAATLEGDDDPWAESIRPALLALAGRDAYATEGDGGEVPLEELPLPVVRVQVDSVSTLALIGSSADFVVLDPSVRAQPGVIDALSIGALRVRSVPHTVRPLAAVRETLGAEIGAVIGLDLLLRLHARIDGPGRRVWLSSEAPPPPGPDAVDAAWVTPAGSFLVVRGQIAGEPVWLSVDTAGLLPVGLVPGADEALGLADAPWQRPSPDGPEVTVTSVRLGGLAIPEMPVVRGVLGQAHARAVGAPVAGSVGWALLGQLTTRFDADGRRLRFE